MHNIIKFSVLLIKFHINKPKLKANWLKNIRYHHFVDEFHQVICYVGCWCNVLTYAEVLYVVFHYKNVRHKNTHKHALTRCKNVILSHSWRNYSANKLPFDFRGQTSSAASPGQNVTFLLSISSLLLFTFDHLRALRYRNTSVINHSYCIKR